MQEDIVTIMEHAGSERPAGEKPPSAERPSPGRRHRARAERDKVAARAKAGSRQVRFENSKAGRIILNTGLVVTLAAVLIAVLPASVLKDRLLPVAQPYLNVLGMGEDWGVFAPDPRTQVVYGGAIIRYTDGSESVWNFPVRPGVMAYSDYRWQKFEEHVRLDAFKGLWKPFADYLAADEATPGKTPVQIGLVRKWADIHPPGAPTSLGPWSQYVYYVAPVGGTK
jgi:hypothetical protein